MELPRNSDVTRTVEPFPTTTTGFSLMWSRPPTTPPNFVTIKPTTTTTSWQGPAKLGCQVTTLCVAELSRQDIAWPSRSAMPLAIKRPSHVYVPRTFFVTSYPSENTFADIHDGNVAWSGSLLATDLTSFRPVFGDAEINLAADTMDGTVTFTALETVQKSDRGLAELTDWRVGRLDYPVSVTGAGFQDPDGRVTGTLFGSSHEEAAGILYDGVEYIAGAFGGTRPFETPSFEAPFSETPFGRSEIYENIAGIDPRDTWKPTRAIESYFNLAPHARRSDPSRLRGSVLGSRDGVYYTQQMSGPTDTIDIDFTGYFSDMPDFVQGLLERGGKSWSYRLMDVLGSHLLHDYVVTRLGRDELV